MSDGPRGRGGGRADGSAKRGAPLSGGGGSGRGERDGGGARAGGGGGARGVKRALPGGGGRPESGRVARGGAGGGAIGAAAAAAGAAGPAGTSGRNPKPPSAAAAAAAAAASSASTSAAATAASWRDCDLCGCRVNASGWEQHVQGIAHRRASLSVRVHGEPGHAVVSVFERAFAGDAAAQAQAAAQATAGQRRREEQQQQQRQQRRQGPPSASSTAPDLPAWISPAGGAAAAGGRFRVPALPRVGDLPLAALARVRREALTEAAALAGAGGPLYDQVCRRLLAPPAAVRAASEAAAAAAAARGEQRRRPQRQPKPQQQEQREQQQQQQQREQGQHWLHSATREQLDLLPLAWMAAEAGRRIRALRDARRWRDNPYSSWELVSVPMDWFGSVPSAPPGSPRRRATDRAVAGPGEAADFGTGGEIPEITALMMALAALLDAGGARLRLPGPAAAERAQPPMWLLVCPPCLTHGAEALALAAATRTLLRAAARCPSVERATLCLSASAGGDRDLASAVATQGDAALTRMQMPWGRALRGLAAALSPEGGGGDGALEAVWLLITEGVAAEGDMQEVRAAVEAQWRARRRAVLAGAFLPRAGARAGAGAGARATAPRPPPPPPSSPLAKLPVDVLRVVMARALLAARDSAPGIRPGALDRSHSQPVLVQVIPLARASD